MDIPPDGKPWFGGVGRPPPPQSFLPFLVLWSSRREDGFLRHRGGPVPQQGHGAGHQAPHRGHPVPLFSPLVPVTQLFNWTFFLIWVEPDTFNMLGKFENICGIFNIITAITTYYDLHEE